MKKIWIVCLFIFVVAISIKSNSCFADRSLVDRLYSSGPASGADGSNDEAPKPDPFMAERQVALKGAASSGSSSVKSAEGASVEVKKIDVNAASEKSDPEKSDEKKSAPSGSASKQPSMHYYQ